MKDTIITKELLSVLGSCYLNTDLSVATETGHVFTNLFTANDLWGKPESYVVEFLTAHGYLEDLNWYQTQKKTEKFVRYTGKEITMTDTYQVFDPITGQHTEYDNEEAARAAAVEISQQILNIHKISLCRVIRNENGDEAWTAATFTNPIITV